MWVSHQYHVYGGWNLLDCVRCKPNIFRSTFTTLTTVGLLVTLIDHTHMWKLLFKVQTKARVSTESLRHIPIVWLSQQSAFLDKSMSMRNCQLSFGISHNTAFCFNGLPFCLFQRKGVTSLHLRYNIAINDNTVAVSGKDRNSK